MSINSYDVITGNITFIISENMTPVQARDKYGSTRKGAIISVINDNGDEHRWKLMVPRGSVYGYWQES
ncbi:MAG: hypothetical protein ACRC3H_06695 [Lachnospiraceae bacterium]